MPSSLLLSSINPTVYRPSSHPFNRGLVSWWLSVPGYAGFGTNKWLDIVSDNHATLNSGSWAAWQRKAIHLDDKTNHYAGVGKRILDWATDFWTIQVVVTCLDDSDFDRPWLGYGTSWDTDGEWWFGQGISFGSDRHIRLGYRSFGITKTSWTDAKPAAGVLEAYTFRHNIGSNQIGDARLWVGDVLHISGTNANTRHTIDEEFYPLGHGGDVANTSAQNSLIHSVRVYNRHLLDPEAIQTNQLAKQGFSGLLDRISRPVLFVDGGAPASVAQLDEGMLVGGLQPLAGGLV